MACVENPCFASMRRSFLPWLMSGWFQFIFEPRQIQGNRYNNLVALPFRQFRGSSVNAEEPCMIGAFVTSLVLDKRETKIRSMFNNIAPSYDFLNHLLSCNVDHYWRWRTTRIVPPVVLPPHP